MVFGERLAKLRRNAGMTQGELAEVIGAAQSTISQLEAGSRRPSYDMLQGLARALSVDVGYLLSGEMQGLTQEEEAHFQEYRSLPQEARRDLRDYARYLQQRHKSREEGDG